MKIRFGSEECFSYYGRNALKVIRRYPHNETMGLCGKSGPTWSESDDGTIRHEIMHALGAVHEHQHPDYHCADQIDYAALREKGWTNEEIDINIKSISGAYTEYKLAKFDYDKHSIMHYTMEEWYFKKPLKYGCLLRRENNVLSAADWKYLRAMYRP